MLLGITRSLPLKKVPKSASLGQALPLLADIRIGWKVLLGKTVERWSK